MALVNYVCGFCAKDIEPDDTAVSMTITGLRAHNGAAQGIVAHGDCLAERLHPSVPFLAEAFED
jgi:hypothetical protein